MHGRMPRLMAPVESSSQTHPARLGVLGRELRISCVYSINLDIPFSLHLSLRPTSTNG